MEICKKWHMGTILLIFFLTACTCLLQTSRVPPEEALRSRVSAYWDARVQGSPEKAYELLEPKAKEVTSLGAYDNRTNKSDILSYEIQNIDMHLEDNEAMVLVKRSFKIKPGAIPININKIMEQTSEDRWVFIDGKWYSAYATPALNFLKSPGKRPIKKPN